MKKLVVAFLMLMFLVTAAYAKVNVNTADAKALEGLPGIGPAKAAAIVDYRTEHGNFTSVDDLAKVKGIGPGILSKIKDEIEVGADPAADNTTAEDATKKSAAKK